VEDRQGRDSCRNAQQLQELNELRKRENKAEEGKEKPDMEVDDGSNLFSDDILEKM
jgi:hypothetical protein